MVKIEYEKQTKSRATEYRLAASGHAGYAPEGQDIVCAAVSILITTLANALSDSGAYDLQVSLQPGDSEISCSAMHGDWEIDVLFRSAMIGLELLEEQYPDNVEISAE